MVENSYVFRVTVFHGFPSCLNQQMYVGSLQVPSNDPVRRSVTVHYSATTQLSAPSALKQELKVTEY